MAIVRIQLSNLPKKTTEALVRQVLGPLGHVISVRAQGDSYLVEMEGATSLDALDSSGIGEIRLGDLRQVDSTGLGELSNATIRIA